MDNEIIKPSHNKNPDFVSGKTDRIKGYNFECLSCGKTLTIAFKKQIENSWAGRTKNVNDQEYLYLKEYYKIGQSHKSHDGGLPVFDKISCKKCSANYLTYSGVTEFSNSTFAVQIQGIILYGQ